MKDIYSLSDTQMQKRIGEKLKSVRLKQNITQKNLSEEAGISLSSIKKIESGEIGSFESLLRVMRVLGKLDTFQNLIAEEQLSPSEYYELVNAGKKNSRKRAAGKPKTEKEEPEW
ncbi:MAG TPA: XRE family transcriptional regulator [Rikenellaceae bacterium]|nr:XRE family transcriptional regulator [Rikenellaceae bacterium]